MNDWQAQAPDPKNGAACAIVALGANLPVGDTPPIETVAQAISILRTEIDTDLRASRLFRTPAFPPGAGPDFINAAVRLTWTGSASALLSALNRIEARFGRTRSQRWEARIMDLDLIALGDTVLPDVATQSHWAGLSADEAARITPDALIVPHPRLAERGFVLVPVGDVAPDWRHPVTGHSIADMRARRPRAEIAEIEAIRAAPIADEPLSFTAPTDT